MKCKYLDDSTINLYIKEGINNILNHLYVCEKHPDDNFEKWRLEKAIYDLYPIVKASMVNGEISKDKCNEIISFFNNLL